MFDAESYRRRRNEKEQMNIQFNLSKVLAVFVLITTVSMSAQPTPKPQKDPAMVDLGNVFVSNLSNTSHRLIAFTHGQ